MPLNDLDTRLLAAHAADDKPTLALLYGEAADVANDLDGECFYLTYAYVFALDVGMDVANDYYQRLRANGREE